MIPPIFANVLQKIKWRMLLPIVFFVIIMPTVSLVGANFYSRSREKNLNLKYRQLVNKYNNVAKVYLALKKKYEDLQLDRDNVLNQTKNLLSEKSKFDEIKQNAEDLEKANGILTTQKDKLHQESEKLRAERQMLAENYNRLKKEYDEDINKQAALMTENENLRAAFQKQVESSPQYQKVDAENKALKTDNQTLKDTIKRLTDRLNKANDRIKKINGRDLKFGKQIEGYKKNLNHLLQEKAQLEETNKAMNKAVEEAPDKFRDMAEENKRLLRETAEMHYNLGVFYTENKNYTLAVKEFQRALDFNPNNAKVHYNLGYLLSEEFDRHEEAMAHFKRYLEINPNSKESDEVRNYMLVRQAYGDKIGKN